MSELCKRSDCVREGYEDGYCSMHRFDVSGLEYKDYLKLQDEVKSLKSLNEELVKRLNKYGGHLDSCVAFTAGPFKDCTCGFEEALTQDSAKSGG